MDFSIIIINYKTKELLDDCLASIFKHLRGNFEVIVIDNASSDGSVEFILKKYGDRIRIIANDKNIGFGPANNIGAKNSIGEYLLFLNSDTTVFQDILKQIINLFDTNGNIGAISPRLLLLDGNIQPFAYGRFPDIFNLLSSRFVKNIESERGIFEADWIAGTAMFVRRDLFFNIGGFDENFFMYYEDIDLCKRIKEAGYSIYVHPGVSVVHHVGGSGNDYAKIKKKYYISQSYYFRKHYGRVYSYLIRIIRFPVKIFRQINIAKNNKCIKGRGRIFPG